MQYFTDIINWNIPHSVTLKNEGLKTIRDTLVFTIYASKLTNLLINPANSMNLV